MASSKPKLSLKLSLDRKPPGPVQLPAMRKPRTQQQPAASFASAAAAAAAAAAATAAITRPPLTIDGLPVELLALIMSFLDSTADLAAASLVSRIWRVASRFPNVWRNTTMLVRNPQWIPSESGFFALCQGARMHGLVVLRPNQRAALRQHGIARIALIGPNVLRETAHMTQLCREVPKMQMLTLHRCILRSDAAQPLLALANLRHLVLEHDWSDIAAVAGLPITRLTLRHCTINDRMLLAGVRGLPSLRQLDLQGCTRVTRDGVVRLREALPSLRVAVTVAPSIPAPPPLSTAATAAAAAASRPSSAASCAATSSSGEALVVADTKPAWSDLTWQGSVDWAQEIA